MYDRGKDKLRAASAQFSKRERNAMPLRFTEGSGRITAHLSGEIDHQVAREMMLALDREVAVRAPAQLQVDMSEVTFMDSSGIAVLLRTWERLEPTAARMTVVGVPPQPKKVFHAAGLDKIIPMEP